MDAVDRLKEEREYAVKSGIEREVALFRAAREERGMTETILEGGVDDAKEQGDDVDIKAPIAATKKDAKNIVPKFTIKKKRKRVPQESGANDNDTNKKVAVPTEKTNEAHADKKREGSADGNAQNSEGGKPKATKNDSKSDNEDGGGLIGLACYGSDSD